MCRSLIDARHLRADLIRHDNSWDFVVKKFRLPRAHQRSHAVKMGSIARLNGRGLCASPTRNAEAVKNYPRGVGTIECIEVNAGDVVIQKIVTLFQGEVNTDATDHFRIVFASL
jgi:hypothetical protein